MSFCEINNLNGFEDGIYFGEYFKNPNFREINIYGKTNSYDWKVCIHLKMNLQLIISIH